MALLRRRSTSPGHKSLLVCCYLYPYHYNDVIVGAIASQITSLTIVYSTVSSDADQIKNQSSASLAFVRGIHRGPVNSPRKWPVTRKMFPFSDVIMKNVTFRIKCNHLYPVNRLKILSAKMSPFFEGHDMLLQNEFLVYCQMTAYTICTTQFGLHN